VEQPSFPHATDAERLLLGGLMRDPVDLAVIAEVVKPDDFYRPEHGTLFGLLVSMQGRGIPIDPVVTVADHMAREGKAEQYGGLAYVMELPDRVPATANLRHYAEMVREKSLLRQLVETADWVRESALMQPEDVPLLLDEAAARITGVGLTMGRRSWQPISLTVDEQLVEIDKLTKHESETTGRSTGFEDVDKMLAGLHPTDLLILAARPGMGKTALALNIAQNVALKEEVPVGIFSLEMGRAQLVTRMLCCEGFVDAGKVRTGTLEQDDWARLLEASERLRRTKVHIDDSPGLSIGEVRTRARRLQAEVKDIGLIVIDYLQLMRGDDPRAPREQQISSISRGLKGLAKDLNCPIMALSQLNRGVESRADKRPMVSDLRESGAIEQDADVIMFIYRDDYYNKPSDDPGVAEIIVAKQRNGPTGTARLAWLGKYTRFDSVDAQLLG
jgi:replicative DNA helicase